MIPSKSFGYPSQAPLFAQTSAGQALHLKGAGGQMYVSDLWPPGRFLAGLRFGA